MNTLQKSLSIFLAVALFIPALRAQENENGIAIDPDAVVLLGAVVAASVAADQVVFNHLADGTRSIVILADGTIVVQARTDFDPSLRSASNADLRALSDAQHRLMVSQLQGALQLLIAELRNPEAQVTEQDVVEVVKFMLSVDLPWDEGFFADAPTVMQVVRSNNVEDPFGQLDRETPAIFEEPTPTPTPAPTPPPVVTPPVTPGPYFAP